MTAEPGGLIEAHARIIGHKPKVDDQVGGLPLEGDRRAAATKPPEPAKAVRLLLAPRTVATVLDTAGVLAMAGGASYVLRTGFYETAGVLAILYYGVATMTLGSSAGTLVVAALRQRMPSLFDRRGPAPSSRIVSTQRRRFPRAGLRPSNLSTDSNVRGGVVSNLSGRIPEILPRRMRLRPAALSRTLRPPPVFLLIRTRPAARD